MKGNIFETTVEEERDDVVKNKSNWGEEEHWRALKIEQTS